jgi:hypothetical protein
LDADPVTPEPSVLVLITIGNEGTLSPYQWAAFHQEARHEIDLAGATVHGDWHSAPTAPWQNACFLVEILPGIADRLRECLGVVGRQYGYRTAAWAEVSRADYLT